MSISIPIVSRDALSSCIVGMLNACRICKAHGVNEEKRAYLSLALRSLNNARESLKRDGDIDATGNHALAFSNIMSARAMLRCYHGDFEGARKLIVERNETMAHHYNSRVGHYVPTLSAPVTRDPRPVLTIFNSALAVVNAGIVLFAFTLLVIG